MGAFKDAQTASGLRLSLVLSIVSHEHAVSECGVTSELTFGDSGRSRRQFILHWGQPALLPLLPGKLQLALA